MYPYPFFQTLLFENILAINVHTWHWPIQDRFLYLYIKIQKKKPFIKCLNNVQSLGEKFSSSVKVF